MYNRCFCFSSVVGMSSLYIYSFALLFLALSPVHSDQPDGTKIERNSRFIRSYSRSKSEIRQRPNTVFNDVTEKPYLDMDDNVTVTVQLGKAAYLICTVNKIADKTVSWVRKKDFHILTVGTYLYTKDQRFKAVHQDGSNDWTLIIKYTKEEDAGLYECQVNSEPMISKVVKLILVAAKVEILEAPDLYVNKKSTINLTCQITHAAKAPVYVFWYHNGKVINYENDRNWVSVKTGKHIITTSKLMITSAEESDSGSYSCAPSYADPATITVNVINGENSAAMQSNQPNSSPFLSSIFLYPLVFLLLINSAFWTAS